MLDPDFAKRVAERAYPLALAFFQPSPEWFLEPIAAEAIDEDDGGEARLLFRLDYLHGKVIYDPARHDNGEHLWCNVGHEVAHLLLMEYDLIQGGMTGEKERLMTHANERAVTRLTRLWARERPYPGDDQFRGQPP